MNVILNSNFYFITPLFINAGSSSNTNNNNNNNNIYDYYIFTASEYLENCTNHVNYVILFSLFK